ncbi:hypothetical protein L9F63_002833, partial [Diploptera punctata]
IFKSVRHRGGGIKHSLLRNPTSKNHTEIQEIASLVNVPKKSQLIQRLIAYWTLKRQFRNGVPLLRRLQSSHLARRDDPSPPTGGVVLALVLKGELYRQLKYWQCLRQDLERARLLCELVRKREKLKKEFCKVKELWMEVHLQPMVCFMRRLLDLIQSKDTGDIFSEPVDLSEVPDYSDVVTQPMDLSTMRTKVDNFQYPNLDAFEKDFNLMINNCMAYNSRDTIFYRAALNSLGGALIRQAKRDIETIGFDVTTGLLLPDGITQHSSEDGLAGEIDKELAAVMDKSRVMANADRLTKLLELQDRSKGLRHGLARAKRLKLIKTEISKLRRKMALGAGNAPQIRQESATPSSNATPASVKPKSGRGRKKGIVKRNTEDNADSGTNSKLTTSATPNALNTSTSTGSGGLQSSTTAIGQGYRDPRDTPAVVIRNAGINKIEISCISHLIHPVNSTVLNAHVSGKNSSGGLVPPTTPAKLSPSSDQSQPNTVSQLTSVSPSGVNRRTAVLFTRKAAAAAIKKPDSHSGTLGGTSSSANMSSGPSLISNRRRVGRPRKNLDAAMNQCANVEQNLLLAGVSESERASALMPAPPLPCSESFTVYRRGGRGHIPPETDEETQSDSTCSSCSTSDGSTGSSEDGGSSSIDLQQRGASGGESSAEEEGASSGSLEPLDLVWAKCRGYPWYPALIINPKMPRAGYLHNGVPIPAPPADVLALATNYEEPVYLVLFFDTKRTWQWLPRNKLEPLGVSTDVDQAKLTESRKPTDRKAVRKAYQEAMLHRCQVSGGQGKRGRSASVGNSELALTAEEN